MKYSEFHRKILAAGWKFSHAEGSHYFYTKNGKLSEPVPYHGAKEFPEPLTGTIKKKNRKGDGGVSLLPFNPNRITESWKRLL